VRRWGQLRKSYEGTNNLINIAAGDRDLLERADVAHDVQRAPRDSEGLPNEGGEGRAQHRAGGEAAHHLGGVGEASKQDGEVSRVGAQLGGEGVGEGLLDGLVRRHGVSSGISSADAPNAARACLARAMPDRASRRPAVTSGRAWAEPVIASCSR